MTDTTTASRRRSARPRSARPEGVLGALLVASLAAVTATFLDPVAVSLLVLTLVVAAWTWTVWPSDAKGLLSPPVMFPLVFYAYSVGLPFGLLVGTVGTEVDRGAVVTVTWLTIAMLITFMVVTMSLYRLPRRRTTPVDSGRTKHTEDGLSEANLKTIAAALMVMGAILYLAFVLQGFGSILDFIRAPTRAERFLVSRGYGILTSGVFVLNFGWILLLAVHLRTRNPRLLALRMASHLAGIAAYAVFWLRLGDRRVLVSLLVGMAFVVFASRRVRTLWVAALGVAGVIGLHFFSRVRHLVDNVAQLPQYIVSSFRLEWLDPSISELGQQGRIAVELVERVPGELLLGSTYLDGVLSIVPSALWPGRPDAPSVLYAQSIDPTAYESGQAFGFSFIGEAYINFGYLGPIVVGAALALLGWWLYRHLGTGGILRATTYGGVLSALILLPRSDFASLTKQLVVAALIPLVVVLVVGRAVTREAPPRGLRGDQEAPLRLP